MPDEKRHRVHPKTLARSRDLRRDMTPYEQVLWNSLKDKLLNGLKFRRQHPIGPYIVDFFCADARLVIEIDGDSHYESIGYDHQRSAWLIAQGYRVIRFTNEQVKYTTDEVLNTILKEVASIK